MWPRKTLADESDFLMVRFTQLHRAPLTNLSLVRFVDGVFYMINMATLTSRSLILFFDGVFYLITQGCSDQHEVCKAAPGKCAARCVCAKVRAKRSLDLS